MPDIFDLEEWVARTYVGVVEAVHYLHASAQYDLYLKLWHDAGRPEVEVQRC